MAILKNDNNDNFYSDGYWTDGYWADGSKELSLDDLDGIAGGAGSNNGRVTADGTVLGCIGNGVFQVNVDGQTVSAVISGKLRMNYISVQSGDRVQVEYLPNTMRGRIVWRYK